MILALDIGNSQIFCGVFDGDQLKVQVRYASKAQISSDEFGVFLRGALRENNIESGQVHFRNDRYEIFKDHVKGCSFPNMDSVEENYLVLPIHNRVSEKDVYKICNVIQSGW